MAIGIVGLVASPWWSNLLEFVMTMKMCLAGLMCLGTIAFQGRETSSEDKESVLEELRSVVGTYKGSWTIYGIDEKRKVVRKMAWTDTLKAENPVVDGKRAYVTTSAEMVFDDGNIPPMTVPGKEGYLLNHDGTTGDYFIETLGQTFRMERLSENTWAYSVPADPEDLGRLGFSNVLLGQHTLVKIVVVKDGVERHRISRLTTVEWNDRTGKERSIQFISLKGTHERKLTP